MATAGKFNGRLVGVYVGANKIAHANSADVEISTSEINTTTKDSGDYEEYISGVSSGTVSLDGLFAFDASYGYDDLIAMQLAQTTATIKWSTEVAGDTRLSATGFITSLSGSAPNNEAASLSVTFRLTGTITYETIT